jgi:eukaryotic-like serine/threonine-protein kinase
LRHPNIVPIYSLQEDETTGLAALCMPYLGRATLCDVLDRSFLAGRSPQRARAILDAVAAVNCDLDSRESPSAPPVLRRGPYVDGVLHLAVQLADALAHSHGRGIYHRDLKPSNVLMTPEGRPVLLDFNLSVDARLAAWKVGGTLPYMAPEELANLTRQEERSPAHRYDPRSDIFSLGVIVYELLAGRLPFGAIPRDCPLEEAARRLRRQQAGGPKPIRELNGRVDRPLARLVENCLAFEPDRRPETAAQLAAAFRRELSPARRGRRWIGNHRALVLGLGTAFLSIVLAISLFFAMRPPYSARQLQLGLGHIHRGDYAGAVDYLNNAIRANPASAEALFARGQAYQRLGEFGIAQKDYNSAYKLENNPLIKACEGYCVSRANYHRGAIANYRAALAAGYDRPAVLYNNMGYGFLMLAQLNDAEECLAQAAELDGNLQAAHYNLVILAVQRVVHGESIPKAAFFHAARAVEIGPPTADLYHVVSALYATAARQDPSLIQPAIQYVAKAVQLGLPPKTFSSDTCYSALQKEPAFRDALRTRQSSSSPAKVLQLIDPLDQ